MLVSNVLIADKKAFVELENFTNDKDIKRRSHNDDSVRFVSWINIINMRNITRYFESFFIPG